MIDVRWDYCSPSRNLAPNKPSSNFFRNFRAKRIASMLMREVIASKSMR
jgi:hypothetical protein